MLAYGGLGSGSFLNRCIGEGGSLVEAKWSEFVASAGGIGEWGTDGNERLECEAMGEVI